MFNFLFKKKKPVTTVQEINNQVARYPDYGVLKNAERYATMDDVYSIIRKVATTAATIPMLAYEVKDDKKVKRLKALNHKPHEKKLFQLKALEELPDEDQLNSLLLRPNPDQSAMEFMEAAFSSMLIHGDCFMWKNRLELGVNAGKPFSLHLLYPQYVITHVSQTMGGMVHSYSYIIDGRVVAEKIPVEDIIHIKYFNPLFSYQSDQYRGLSPLKVLSKRLTRIQSGMDASVAQLQNGGIPGIIYDENIQETAPGNSDVIGRRKDSFYNYSTKSENKGQPYFAAGKMGYIELGLKLADLEVAELEKIDFKKLCNAFGVSDILFNNSDASTESNVKEMTKSLYTNVILPNLHRIRDAFNNSLIPDFPEKKRFVDYDISEVAELQENFKELAEWLALSWWITPNEKREIMKFGEYNDPMFDLPIIPVGVQRLEDLNIEPIDPIDPVTDNGR